MNLSFCKVPKQQLQFLSHASNSEKLWTHFDKNKMLHSFTAHSLHFFQKFFMTQCKCKLRGSNERSPHDPKTASD